MKRSNIDTIFNEFDKWVISRGNGMYASHEDVLTPIQQIREEIVELVDIIQHIPQKKNALEIGLGVYGGTHMLWRMLFDEIITIDNDQTVVENFKKRENLNSKSTLIIGDSKSVEIKGEFSFLHIDGDHTYEGIKSDYLRFNNLVQPDGVIAIHDALFPSVKQFLNDLQSGIIDGIKHNLKLIIHSKRVGYAYEIKT